MRKLQQFKVIRLNSDRLKPNYKLKEFSYEDSVRNGEVISLSNSQLIRTLLSFVGRPFSEFELKELQSKKRNLKKRKNTERNRELLAEGSNKFVPFSLFLKSYRLAFQTEGIIITSSKGMVFLF